MFVCMNDNQNHVAWILLQKLLVAHLVKKRRTLSCSQGPVNIQYPDPADFTTHQQTQFV
jgi:hypothetical protein